MARVKFGLKDLTTSQLLQKSLHVTSQMSLNQHLFPEPNPIAELELATDELLDAYLQSKLRGSEAVFLKNEKRKNLLALLVKSAAYVQYQSAGVAIIISSSGFEVRKRKAPIGILESPTHLRAVLTNREKTIILRWKPVYGRPCYKIEINEHDVTDESKWQFIQTVTKCKVVLTNLESSKKYWLRVTAVGVLSSAPSAPFLCKTW